MNDNWWPISCSKAGSRKARISLIVDLESKNREDFEEKKTGEKRPQKPCQQIAVFADLVADTVDYEREIGKQHYRLLLNKSLLEIFKVLTLLPYLQRTLKVILFLIRAGASIPPTC